MSAGEAAVSDAALVIATANPGKLGEWRRLLAPLGFTIQSAAEHGVELPAETGKRYVDNAALKAIAAAHATGRVAIGDDTGLCVPSLGGAPGLHTAEFVASCGGWSAAYDEIAARTGLREGARVRASLVCAVVLADASGQRWDAEATIDGHLRWPPNAAPGPAAVFEPEVGLVLDDGVLIHRRAAFMQLLPHLLALV